MELSACIEQAVTYIRSVTEFKPEIGMILGSGLGSYADEIEHPIIIPYQQIPNFPRSTVAGHAGQFVLGTHHGKNVIVMQGRVHYYEGYSQQQITLPVRIMKRLGVEKLVVTNAAGGVNLAFHSGTLMMISDHINFSGSNPLVGANLDDYGPRFPDMSSVYDKQLRGMLKREADKVGISLDEGVYMMLSGPNYETPAEIRMARVLGADAVGMSTVPETMTACHCGMKVVGISCITNMGAGVLDAPLCHDEVVETANRVHSQFVRVLDLLLTKVL